jgi:micrococcal nuclease
MSVARWLLPFLAACRGLDSVEIVSGDHCAPSREETVGCARDGDTLELDDCGGEAIRLLGINAPEIAHDSTEVDECYGPESAAWVSDLTVGRDVRLEFDTTCEDKYFRTLAYIYMLPEEEGDDEVFLNEEIVRQGYARVYEDFDDIRLADTLYAAQDEAQAENRGLWSVCE